MKVKKRKVLAKERKRKGENDFGIVLLPKKAGHNRGPPQQKQPIEDQDCSWTTTLKNCLSAVV